MLVSMNNDPDFPQSRKSQLRFLQEINVETGKPYGFKVIKQIDGYTGVKMEFPGKIDEKIEK